MKKRAAKLTDKKNIVLPAEVSDESEDDDQLRGMMFSQWQTSILQKWFIEHLEHPYAKKLEKKALAQETKLSLKQITGWFTNNRKRKYNRVLALAKKRGRNLDYVRDVMIMKFDKDLDKSLSGRSN